MRDRDCVAFLQWCLPKLGLRRPGFRKVRRQVGKRIDGRIRELGLGGQTAYRDYLESHEAEWKILDSFCQITISRFYRDRGVFDRLRNTILPNLAQRAAARGGPEVRCWSAGCCSGEEAYTLQIIWKLHIVPRFPAAPDLTVLGSTVDAGLIERASRGRYPKSCLKDLPESLRRQAFDERGDHHVIKPTFTENVTFIEQDIRKEIPDGPFQLILCRNLALTYFNEDLQRKTIEGLLCRMKNNGYLVIGIHESLPPGVSSLFADQREPCIMQLRKR